MEGDAGNPGSFVNESFFLGRSGKFTSFPGHDHYSGLWFGIDRVHGSYAGYLSQFLIIAFIFFWKLSHSSKFQSVLQSSLQ